MTAEGTTTYALSLSGYVALGGHGFSLPCFCSGPNANTWYVASCSVPGDHQGTVSGFERFTSDDIKPLRPAETRRIHVGSQWCDVFLWRGEVFVGEPMEIWSQLASKRTEVAAFAPLSLLDVAIPSGVKIWKALARRAFEYVRTCHGEQQAQFWLRETFGRRQLVQHLDRMRQAGKVNFCRDALRDVDADSRLENGFRVVIPDSLERVLAEAGLIDDVLEHIGTTMEPFSVSVEIATPNSNSHIRVYEKRRRPIGRRDSPDSAESADLLESRVQEILSKDVEDRSEHDIARVLQWLFLPSVLAVLYQAAWIAGSEDAKDTVQLVSERLFKSRFRSYDHTKGPILPWLFVVIRHAARNRRNQLPHSTAPESVELEDTTRLQLDEYTDIRQRYRSVMAILESSVSKRDRDIFLALAQGHTAAELALRYGLSEPTVRKVRSRIRRKLRTSLADNDFLSN